MSPLSTTSTFLSSPSYLSSPPSTLSPASMCSISPAFSFSPSFVYSPNELQNSCNIFSFPPAEHLSLSGYLQHLAGKSRAFQDLVQTNELAKIHKARSALEPPEWSKRQQGHRRGMARTMYSKEKKALLVSFILKKLSFYIFFEIS